MHTLNNYAPLQYLTLAVTITLWSRLDSLAVTVSLIDCAHALIHSWLQKSKHRRFPSPVQAANCTFVSPGDGGTIRVFSVALRPQRLC